MNEKAQRTQMMLMDILKLIYKQYKPISCLNVHIFQTLFC